MEVNLMRYPPKHTVRKVADPFFAHAWQEVYKGYVIIFRPSVSV
jgi:hypothetical protein